MITQQIGLRYLVPMALEKLNENILAEGNLFEGDLLDAVLSVNMDYWKTEPKRFIELGEIIKKNEEMLHVEHPKLMKSILKLNAIL